MGYNVECDHTGPNSKGERTRLHSIRFRDTKKKTVENEARKKKLQTFCISLK